MKHAVTFDSFALPYTPTTEPTQPRALPGHAPWRLDSSTALLFTDDAGYSRVLLVWNWTARKLVLGLF